MKEQCKFNDKKEKEIGTRTQITPDDIEKRTSGNGRGATDDELEMEVTILNPDVESMDSRG